MGHMATYGPYDHMDHITIYGHMTSYMGEVQSLYVAIWSHTGTVPLPYWSYEPYGPYIGHMAHIRGMRPYMSHMTRIGPYAPYVAYWPYTGTVPLPYWPYMGHMSIYDHIGI